MIYSSAVAEILAELQALKTKVESLDHSEYAASVGGAVKLDDNLAPDDNTDLNASTTKHGLLPKLDNIATNFFNGQGTWAAPAGGGAHAATHVSGGADAIKLDDLAAGDDNTDLNTSITKHGLAPKLSNVATEFLNGVGAFSAPAAAAHAATHQSGGGDTIKIDDLTHGDDNTDLNATGTYHGLMPKLPLDGNQFLNGGGTWATPPGVAGAIKLDDHATPDDNTDLNASITAHGLLKKLSNVATEFLNGVGVWTVPSGGAGTVKLDDHAAPDDNTDLNVSADKHGLMPKLSNLATQFMNGQGSWDFPPNTLSDGVPSTVHGTTSDPGAYDTSSRSDHVHKHGDLSASSATTHHHWDSITGKPAAFTPSAHAASHASGAADAVKIDDLAAGDDNTDLNVSITKHGLTPKLSNVATEYLNGTGGYSVPAGGAGTVKLDDHAAPDDNTDLNASITKHGLLPKLSNVATEFLNGVGAFTVPAGGAGTVTSVGLALPAELTVSNSPVTAAGTLTGVWANENANLIFAGPASGAAATPGFRALTLADLSTLLPFCHCGRLTLESGVPVPATDQIAKSTLYWTPCNGKLISLYDGTNWVTIASPEVSLNISALGRSQAYTNDPAAGSNIELNMASTAGFLVKDRVLVSSSAGSETAEVTVVHTDTHLTVNSLALNHTTTNPVVTGLLPYDIFGYLNAGALVLEALAWTNNTTRATALALQDGVWVKSGDATRKHLGTIIMTNVVGCCTDAVIGRLVWNRYNQVKRSSTALQAADHLYNGGATPRLWNNSTTNNEIKVAIGEKSTVVAMIAGWMQDIANTRFYLDGVFITEFDCGNYNPEWTSSGQTRNIDLSAGLHYANAYEAGTTASSEFYNMYLSMSLLM